MVAEITPINPNVYYEVGYSHAINKPTILIVDDDKIIADAMARALKLAGYEIRTAESCKEGLKIAFDERGAAPGVYRLAVERELHDVARRDKCGRERTRHEEAIGIVRVPHRDVTRRIEHALIHQDAARRSEVLENGALHRLSAHLRRRRMPGPTSPTCPR